MIELKGNHKNGKTYINHNGRNFVIWRDTE